MKTTYEKPACEVILLEAEEGVMALSSRSAPESPTVNTGGSSDEKNFWSR